MEIYEKRERRIQEYLAEKNLNCTIITSPQHIFYLSGYLPNVDYPCALLIPKDGTKVLVISESELGCLNGKRTFPEIKIYLDYSIRQRIDVSLNFLKVIKDVLKRFLKKRNIIGIEGLNFTYNFADEIVREFPNTELNDISCVLMQMRVIKSAEELGLIKKAVKIADLGQKVVKENLRESISELELYIKIKSEMEASVGEPIKLRADLISGSRTELMGGKPSLKKIEIGDLVITDLSPEVGGYWGDTTTTSVLGRPSKRQKEMLKIVLAALQEGIEEIQPGIKACVLDKVVRTFIEKAGYGKYFPHHTGHGIGLGHFESPLIIPGNNQELKEGMVFTIEPGIYLPRVGGVRVEEDVLVTRSGAEVLSTSKSFL